MAAGILEYNKEQQFQNSGAKNAVCQQYDVNAAEKIKAIKIAVLKERVKNALLSDYMIKRIKEYKQTAPFDNKRDDRLWLWLKVGAEETPMVDEEGQDCVDEEWREQVSELMQRSIFIDVLIDDIVDQLQEEDFLEEVLVMVEEVSEKNINQVIADQVDKKRSDYLKLIKEVWDDFNKEVKLLPRYEDFKDQLNQGFEDLWAAFRTSLVLKNIAKHKTTRILSLDEVERVLSSNMHIMLNYIIRLMASSKFNKNELPYVLEFAKLDELHGNSINDEFTLPVELLQGDFASYPVVRALREKILSYEKIQEAMSQSNHKKLLSEVLEEILDQTYLESRRQGWLDRQDELADHIHSFNARAVSRNNREKHRLMHEMIKIEVLK